MPPGYNGVLLKRPPSSLNDHGVHLITKKKGNKIRQGHMGICLRATITYDRNFWLNYGCKRRTTVLFTLGKDICLGNVLRGLCPGRKEVMLHLQVKSKIKRWEKEQFLSHLLSDLLPFLFQDFLLLVCVIHDVLPTNKELALHCLKSKKLRGAGEKFHIIRTLRIPTLPLQP